MLPVYTLTPTTEMRAHAAGMPMTAKNGPPECTDAFIHWETQISSLVYIKLEI